MVPLVTSRTPAFFLQISARVLPCSPVLSPCYEFCTHFAERIIPHRHLYVMATPAMNFVAVCANANLPLPTSKSRQQAFLKDSGAVMSTSISAAEVKERAASLVWLRHAVANNIPPNTWPSLLAPALLTDVRGIYPIPPAKAGADPAETDLHRLARVVPLFMPYVTPAGTALPLPQAMPTTHGAPPFPSGGINTQRPPGAPGAPPAPPAPQPSGAPAPPSPQPAGPCTTTAKRKWMMHDELYAALSDHVYSALDACTHLPLAQHSKLQEACKKSSSGALFDAATGAPFGHQLQLSLAENAHFDPVKRDLALAIAGRSAGVKTAGASTLLDATGRRAVLQEFHSHWSVMENHFGGAHEISGPNVSRLCGVSFIMQARAARSASWGCP